MKAKRKEEHPIHKHVSHISLFLTGGATLLAFVLMAVQNILALSVQLPSGPVLPLLKQNGTSQLEEFKHFPLLFEENLGQADERAAFIVRYRSTSLLFMKDALVFSLPDQILKQTFIKATPARVIGLEKAPSVSNYLIGNNPKNWQTGIQNYRSIRYEGLYPGIELEYISNNEGELGYQYVLAPGAQASAIQLKLDGAEKLATTDNGTTLVVTLKNGDLRWTGLKAFQIKEGKHIPVDASFSVKEKNQYGFSLGKYDPKLELIIDPLAVLNYSSYLGGSGNEPSTPTMVEDSSGNLIVFGSTASTNFPTLNPYQAANAGGDDLFVSKFTPNGQTLLYSTYLGGAGTEQALEVGIDSSDNVYLCGSTSSSNYPVANAAQGTLSGSSDGYLTKLNAAGTALTYSTYLGGSGTDNCVGLDVTSVGEVALTGFVSSTNFPLVNAAQGTYGGGSFDNIVMKYDANGAIVFSTYLGGSVSDFASKALFDPSGNVLSIGRTQSTNFPTLNPMQAATAGSDDGYITKYSSTGTMLYSTYLGGSGADFLSAAIMNSTGNLYLGGSTASTNFPTVNPFQPANAGGSRDSHVMMLSAGLNSIAWSSYLGGNGFENSAGLALDAQNNVYFTGTTDSTNYPVVSAFQPNKSSNRDVIVGKLRFDGTRIEYLSHLGGTGAGLDEVGGNGIVNNNGEFVIAGRTSSSDFPLAGSSYQTTFGGGTNDVFIARISFCLVCETGGGDSSGPAARLVVASPNGFERFKAGDEVRVTWIAQGLSDELPLKLSLVLDAGKLVIPIADGLKLGDEGYTWILPSFVTLTTPAKIRLELVDPNGYPIMIDESDYFFDIIGTPVVVPIEPVPEPAPIPVPMPEIPSEPIIDPSVPPTPAATVIPNLIRDTPPTPQTVKPLPPPIPVITRPSSPSAPIPEPQPELSALQSLFNSLRAFFARILQYIGF